MPLKLQRKRCFSSLKVGQQVGLKDHGAAFEINFLTEELPQGQTVIEIGDDFVVLEDVADSHANDDPGYSVKAIVRFNVK